MTHDGGVEIPEDAELPEQWASRIGDELERAADAEVYDSLSTHEAIELRRACRIALAHLDAVIAHCMLDLVDDLGLADDPERGKRET